MNLMTEKEKQEKELQAKDGRVFTVEGIEAAYFDVSNRLNLAHKEITDLADKNERLLCIIKNLTQRKGRKK